jgi:arylsulfatase A-like enzyme/Flp pilus assembly protein TadD
VLRTCAAIALLAAVTVLQAQPARPNLLLITLDTVRADHLGAYGYRGTATPALDRLAREGVRFANATTQSPLTGPAHAAMLTGVYPARYGVRDNATTPVPEQAVTLAESLKTAGYRTGGFIGAFVLGREYGFAQGFDEFDARFDRFEASMKLQAQRRGGAVVDAASAWISRQTGDQPFFAWVHLYDAHAPYAAPPPFAATYRTNPYDGEIAYVDACVARLVSLLEREGRLDRTLVVAMADHGEGLGDHGEGEHGLFLYEPVLHVPWVMRLPGRAAAGRVVDEQVRSIDLVPTVAALLGTAAPSGIDGESLAPVIKGGARRDTPPSYAETYYPKLHYGWSELRAVRADTWKYIDAPRPELYNMTTDAAERTNAIDSRAPLAAGLLAALNRLQAGFGALASVPAPQPDPETLARLRSLGYIGIATPNGSTARGPDPKDMAPKVRVANETLSRAIDDLNAGRVDAALVRLHQLSAINDRWYDIHLLMGDAYLAKKDVERALGEYAAAALLNPTSAAPALSTARALIAQGALDRALQKIDEAARLEPASSEVPLERGRAYERQEQYDKALAEYQTSVRLNGSDPRARARLADLALRLRRLDLAEGEFRELIGMKYRPAETHYGLGRLAELRGDTRRAAVEYRQAIALNPSLADAKAALARIGSSVPK